MYDLDVCNAFSLSFVPRDPSECFKSLANTQPNVQADLNQRTRSKGPDTIYVQIDGAERRRTEIPSHFDDSTCTYKFDVRLHNAGPIWLNLTYLYNVRETLLNLSPRYFRKLQGCEAFWARG